METQLHKLTLKFLGKHKRPRITKTILRKQSKAEGLTLPAPKLPLQSHITPDSGVLQKTAVQINATEQSAEINPQICVPLMSTRMPKQFNREKRLFKK